MNKIAREFYTVNKPGVKYILCVAQMLYATLYMLLVTLVG